MGLELLLVGWDGATFALLEPLARKGVMPNLQGLLSRGIRADLLSIVPPLTPPAWTSLITGRSPGYHGVFDFFQKESPGSIHLRMALSGNIRAETLWSMLNRQGKKTTVLNFPVMFPPPPVDGTLISGGWLTWRQLRLACHPASLYEEIRNLPGLDLRTLAMDMAHEARAVEGCSSDELLSFVERHIQRERHWFRILAHLMDTRPTETVAVLFDGIDKIQHLCWTRLADWSRQETTRPAPGDPVLEAALAYYRELDGILGRLLDRMEENTHLLIVSDHGFGESRDIFFVNQWLHEQGLLAWKEDKGPAPAGDQHLGMSHISRHVFEMDWERTRAFAATPSSNGIHLLPLETDDPAEVREKRELEERIIAGLTALRSPTTGEALVRRVWRRGEAFPGPYGNLGPDLTLSLWDGGLVSILASDGPVRRRSEPVGSHRPEGVFVGQGPALLEGERHPPISLLDVTPVALHAVGLPVPAGLEGRPPETLFREGFRRVHLQEGNGAAPTPAGTEAGVMAEGEEEAIAEQLRQLGYLE